MPVDHPTTPVEYRTIARFPGYRFGSDGSAWSSWRQVAPGPNGGAMWSISGAWRPLAPVLTVSGYQQVVIRDRHAGRRGAYRLHRLILEAFVGPCPPGMVACHNNGDRTDNRIENLRWDTSKANSQDIELHGRRAKGSRQGAAKLTEDDVATIRRLVASGVSQASLIRRYGICRTQMENIVHRRHWQHVP